MNNKKIIPLILFGLSSCIAYSANTMVGNCAMREASVWIDAETDMPISAICTDQAGKQTIARFSRKPDASNAYTTIAVFENLIPNTFYKYAVKLADKEISSGSFTTKPDFLDRTPPPDFSFALFGENHINDKSFDPPFRTPGGEYEIYDSANTKNPSFSIWLGGTNALRAADLDSRSGRISRFFDFRRLPEAKKLLTSRANYGVVAQNSYIGKGLDSDSACVDLASEVFDLAWANPKGKVNKAYSFSYSDADFFVLDDCSERTLLDHGRERPRYLGEAQIRWLKGALKNSKATFKFIVVNSPFANPAPNDRNFTYTEEERTEILSFLDSAKISGVVFLTANKPFGELTRLIRANAYPIYDMTTSVATARPVDEPDEMNYFRVPNSTSAKRAFTIVKVDGAENDRAITFSSFDSKGNQISSTTIKASELKKFE